MKSFHILSILGTAAIVSACSNDLTLRNFPDTYNDHHYWAARQAIHIDQPELAAPHLKKAAKNGDYNAMTMLGRIYTNGIGVNKDLVQALKWYERAVQDPSDSQIAIVKRLGDIYSRGEGTTANESKADKFWKRALTYYEAKEKLTYSEAQTLAIMYARGQGTDSNGKKAIKLLTEHYVSGRGSIARVLGDIYHQGLGIRLDHEKAVYWYNVSLNDGDHGRLRYLADLYKTGNGTEIDQEKAEKLYRKHVAQLEDRLNDPDIHDSYIRELAQMYANGKGVDKVDGLHAVKLLSRLTGRDGGLNERLIGDIFFNGTGLEKPEPTQAIGWYQKAIDLGDKARLAKMAYIYNTGVSVEKDMQKAQKYWKLSLNHLNALGEKRSPSETRRLANMLANGQGTKADVNKAIAHLMTLTNRGEGYAERIIGDYYFSAVGMSKPDMTQALQWYEKASSQGSKVRYERLGNMYNKAQGTAIDTAKADKYWKLAAQTYEIHNEERAPWETRALARLYSDGRGVEKNLEKALSIYKEGALKNDPYAARYGGDIAYELKDMVTARNLYNIAVQNNDYQRIGQLADMIGDGVGGDRDPVRAKKLYAQYRDLLESKKSSNGYASLKLARLYISGKAGQTDIKQALKLLTNISADIPVAAIQIGDLYYSGAKIPRNYKTAFSWYQKSLSAGQKSRLRRIADMYDRGQGVKMNKIKAKKLFKEADTI